MLSEHFWVGDRILTGVPTAQEASAEPGPGPQQRGPRGGPTAAGPAPGRNPDPAGEPGALLPPPGRLMIYGGVFLVGYLLATVASAWERQRFVESVVASNAVASLLRLGLADELDRLLGDLSSLGRPLEVAQSKAQQADETFGAIRAQLLAAIQRTTTLKARYGNTPAEDDLLRRILLERYNQLARSQAPAAPAGPVPKAEAATSTPSAATDATKRP